VAEVNGASKDSQLTDRGRETTLALGQRIRNLYVDQLGFLPQTFVDADSLYIRYPFLRAQAYLEVK
jgi:acid phosphatase